MKNSEIPILNGMNNQLDEKQPDDTLDEKQLGSETSHSSRMPASPNPVAADKSFSPLKPGNLSVQLQLGTFSQASST